MLTFPARIKNCRNH